MRVFDENLNPLETYDMEKGDLTSYAPLGEDAWIYRPYPDWLIEANQKANEESVKAERMNKILQTFSEEVIPSDKLGQLWKITRLGEVEIMREYVPDPNQPTADGSYLHPFAFVAPMAVTSGYWYTDGDDIWECVETGLAESFTAPWFDVIG